jgi:hypothetical protein
MIETQMREPALRWSCPKCRLEWIGCGEGFFGQRYSTCLRCGTDACEPDDAVPAISAARIEARSPAVR